jgi:elongation factor Ts
MGTISASMVKELREMTGAGLMDCKKALTECDGDLESAKDLLRKKGQAMADKKSSRETNEGAINIAQKDNKAGLVKIACETDFVARNEQFQAFISRIAEQVIEVGADDFMEKSSSEGALKEQFVETISKLGENIVFLNAECWEAAEGSLIGAYTHTNSKIGVMVELSSDGSADVDQLTAIARNVAMHIAASKVEAVSEDDLDPAVVTKEEKFLIDQAKDSGKPDNIIEKMVEGRMKKFKKEICLLSQDYVKDPDKTISQYLIDAGKELNVTLAVSRFFKEQF